MHFLITETIEYVINAEDREEAEAIWLDMPYPEVRLPDGSSVPDVQSVDHVIN